MLSVSYRFLIWLQACVNFPLKKPTHILFVCYWDMKSKTDYVCSWIRNIRVEYFEEITVGIKTILNYLLKPYLNEKSVGCNTKIGYKKWRLDDETKRNVGVNKTWIKISIGRKILIEIGLSRNQFQMIQLIRKMQTGKLDEICWKN